MKGILYGVGVGTGDPELMTLKAVRLIRESSVIAVPCAVPKESTAFKIAVQAVPELVQKTLLPLNMPMTTDTAVLKNAHEEAALRAEEYLDRGENVVYITLGDPTVYSSFSCLERVVRRDGYTVQAVNGVTSFCSAAARLGVPLAEGNEAIHIYPYVPDENMIHVGDNYVVMKSGRSMSRVKGVFEDNSFNMYAVENCGMADERAYCRKADIPEVTGYFTLTVSKTK